MEHLKRWRSAVATFVLIGVLATATAFASYSHNLWIWGNNDPRQGALGLGSQAYVYSDPFGYPSGPTYIMTKIDGIGGGYCIAGFNDGGWCADNAHDNGLGAWRSEAGMKLNIVPIGCYSASVKVYISGQIYESRSTDRCFADPPPSNDPEGEPSPTPIVIATGASQAYKFTKPAAGVTFDVNADGQPELISWTEAGADVAFLALDRNGNGRIDDGSELFGDFTLPGASNGFQALRLLAGTTAGSLTASNPLFAQLLLWHDRNHDGVSQAGELSPASATLEAIGLGYTVASRQDGSGNLFKYQGWARRASAGAVSASGDNIVWGTGSKATAADRAAVAREFKIYDVVLTTVQ